MDVIRAQKQALRVEIKTRRAKKPYNPELADDLRVHLAELCLKNGAMRVACYLAFGDEPDTELFIDWAIENDIEVLLPIAHKDGTMSWVKFNGETTVGVFGFAEPVGITADLNQVDMMFIPALAIDQDGRRLGRGKGYYDRALASLSKASPVVAVIYEDELLDSLPTEDHDRLVDAVVTPDGVTLFSDQLN